MKLWTKTRPPARADVTETLSDIVYRNRFALRNVGNIPVERTTEPVKLPKRRRGAGVKFWLTMTILIAFLGFVCWKQVVVPWWAGMQDQWHYGDTHVTIMDADVGHGGVSHFIAEYYKGTIVVVELPGAAFTKYQVYVMAGYFGADNSVVVLTIVPGQTSGKPNLIVSVEGTGFGRTLYNTGMGFSEQAP